MKRYLVVAVCFWLRGVNVLGELVTMIIPPSVTNPSITQNNEDHYVFYDTDVLNYVEPSVFVMLPGTYGRPYNLQSLLHRAAHTGYIAIGLTYVNDKPMASYCEKSSQKDCYWDSRRTVIFGEQYPSSQLTVSPGNSILNRLYSLLVYLVSTDVASGIDYTYLLTSNYATSNFVDSLRYDRMAFGGLSQGGGMATVIGYIYNTSRILTFSSTADFSVDGIYWTEYYLPACNTSLNRFIGLIASQDMAASYIYANWMNQEMPGSLVEVPGNSGGEGGGYGNSHMICSSYLEGLVDCIKAHGSTANDQNTPRGISTGHPYLSDTWKYMLTMDSTAPVDTGSLSTCELNDCNLSLALFLMCFTPIILGISAAIVVCFLASSWGPNSLSLAMEYRNWIQLVKLFLSVLLVSVGPSVGVVYVFIKSKSRYLFYFGQVVGALIGINAGVVLIFVLCLKFLVKRDGEGEDGKKQRPTNLLLEEGPSSTT